jgi:hypothetical protein
MLFPVELGILLQITAACEPYIGRYGMICSLLATPSCFVQQPDRHFKDDKYSPHSLYLYSTPVSERRKWRRTSTVSVMEHALRVCRKACPPASTQGISLYSVLSFRRLDLHSVLRNSCAAASAERAWRVRDIVRVRFCPGTDRLVSCANCKCTERVATLPQTVLPCALALIQQMPMSFAWSGAASSEHI